jgi:endoglucanase
MRVHVVTVSHLAALCAEGDGRTLWEKTFVCGPGEGEWGAYNKTPHDVVLRWMEDCLSNFKRAGWGWALWNFRGSFGILDSERSDVQYEDYEGHRLDHRMLELLQKY